MKVTEKHLNSRDVTKILSWHDVTCVLEEAIIASELTPGTAYPVTEKQWFDGHDPSCSQTDKSTSTDWYQLHRLITDIIIKWCITTDQRYCHICFDPLWGTKLSLLDFDHCVPSMKSADYLVRRVWQEQPLVAIMTPETRRGCFCHKVWHWRVGNMVYGNRRDERMSIPSYVNSVYCSN